MQTQPLIYSIQPKKAPSSGESRGFALLFAMPNMAGSCFGKPAPKYAAPYLVERIEMATMADAPQHIERMAARGFALESR